MIFARPLSWAANCNNTLYPCRARVARAALDSDQISPGNAEPLLLQNAANSSPCKRGLTLVKLSDAEAGQSQGQEGLCIAQRKPNDGPRFSLPDIFISDLA